MKKNNLNQNHHKNLNKTINYQDSQMSEKYRAKLKSDKEKKEEEEEKTKFPRGNWSVQSIISETPKNQMDIKIRNIVHDYTNIDTNDYSYNIFSNLKSKKRMENLDVIDEYELWKTKKINNSEDDVKNKINELKIIFQQ